MTTGRINQVSRLCVSPGGLRSSEDSQMIWRKPLIKKPCPKWSSELLCPDRKNMKICIEIFY
jgi:hypothetical protein